MTTTDTHDPMATLTYLAPDDDRSDRYGFQLTGVGERGEEAGVTLHSDGLTNAEVAAIFRRLADDLERPVDADGEKPLDDVEQG